MVLVLLNVIFHIQVNMDLFKKCLKIRVTFDSGQGFESNSYHTFILVRVGRLIDL